MSYNRWNKRFIKKQIDLTKLKNNDGTYDLDLDILKQLYEDTIKPFDVELSLEEKLEFDKETLDKYSPFISDIKTFANTPMPSKKIYISEIKVSDNELLSFAHEFFSTLDPTWKSLFNEVYNEKNYNIRIGNYSSFELFLPNLRYSYLSISKKRSVEDFFNVIHEYTHSIVERIHYRYTYSNDYPFDELPSLTMELISKDLLNSTYSCLSDEIDTYIIALLNSIKSYAKQIIDSSTFLTQLDFSNDFDAFEKIQFYAKGNIEKEENLSSKLLLINFSYTIPLLTAIELYYMYKDDKEKALYLLNQIINLSEKCDFLNYLNKEGIYLNKNVNKLLKEIKRN